MSHKRRRQRNKFSECGHIGMGKYCHRCKDEAAGRIKPKKMVENESGQQVEATEKPKKFWNKAKCPYCGGNRVKKIDLNVLSDNEAKEYRCISFECGKEFNSEQVKEYEKVEVQERLPRDWNPRLTD